MVAPEDLDREPDIVLEILRRAREAAPTELTDDKLREIEDSVRADFGGERYRIPKRKKHPSPEQRQRVFQAALTDAPTEEITRTEGISRRTLYRYLKRGGK